MSCSFSGAAHARNVADFPNSDGSLPLHMALSQKEPSLQIVSLLVEGSPEALPVANSAGSLPVHVAVSQANCSLDILSVLVETHPEALQEVDGKGWLPFQIAAANVAALDVLFYLVTKWPAAGTSKGGGRAKAVAVEDSSATKKRKREL